MAEVKIQDGESIESALRRFKRRVQQEDIIKEVKKHSYYMKPGDKRRATPAVERDSGRGGRRQSRSTGGRLARARELGRNTGASVGRRRLADSVRRELVGGERPAYGLGRGGGRRPIGYPRHR